MGQSFSGQTSRISGWGVTSDTSTSISEVLMSVFVDVISNFLCNLSYLGIIQSTHICTSGSDGRGSCSGDSGGPVVIGNKQVCPNRSTKMFLDDNVFLFAGRYCVVWIKSWMPTWVAFWTHSRDVLLELDRSQL